MATHGVNYSLQGKSGLTMFLNKAESKGTFFVNENNIYFVKRTDQEDQLIKIFDGQEQVVLTFPPQTIRKFFGVSAANKGHFIATLKIANESDISKKAVEITH